MEIDDIEYIGGEKSNDRLVFRRHNFKLRKRMTKERMELEKISRQQENITNWQQMAELVQRSLILQ
jgi:hypothetical protein